MVLSRIVSGGQTGADRGALDAALELGIDCGGWCPRGRRAEDGAIPARYPVTETDAATYRVRTERNVVDSDATVVVTRGAPTGGSALTATFAHRHARPVLCLDLAAETATAAAERLAAWVAAENVAVLNVAGTRESGCPGLADDVRRLIVTVYRTLNS